MLEKGASSIVKGTVKQRSPTRVLPYSPLKAGWSPILGDKNQRRKRKKMLVQEDKSKDHHCIIQQVKFI